MEHSFKLILFFNPLNLNSLTPTHNLNPNCNYLRHKTILISFSVIQSLNLCFYYSNFPNIKNYNH